MPLYLFESADGRNTEIYFPIADAPAFGAEVFHEGEYWKRIPSVPYASTNTAADPYSSKDFNKQFDGKKVTIGDMWDASKEASEKRASKDGVDKVKQKFYDNYAKERKGIRHQNENKENLKKGLEQISKEVKKKFDV